MKAFRFSLAQVLRHKQWLEDQAKKTLAEAMDTLRKGNEELDSLLQRQLDVLSAPMGNGDHIARERMQVLEYTRHLGVRIQRQKRNCHDLRQTVEQRSRELALAMKSRKVLEKLRDRQYFDYQVDRKRKEAVVLDEVSSAFHRRRHGDEEI